MEPDDKNPTLVTLAAQMSAITQILQAEQRARHRLTPEREQQIRNFTYYEDYHCDAVSELLNEIDALRAELETDKLEDEYFAESARENEKDEKK